ncbi:hypothetical protein CK203_034061 [Vitis vinifera]|uniref:Uncharacterized protein n=1 Tax=Vitis vinifera TaxID=29760 RepID=A0A438IBD1_VITVI|nr:hypothetical protein CK203_034061 [Vitis vinifera]
MTFRIRKARVSLKLRSHPTHSQSQEIYKFFFSSFYFLYFGIGNSRTQIIRDLLRLNLSWMEVIGRLIFLLIHAIRIVNKM